MNKFARLALSLTLLLALSAHAAPSQAASWQAKVDPGVLASAALAETEYLIFLEQQADLSAAAQIADKARKGQYVYTQLSQLAERTQPPILAELQSQGIQHRSYWIANLIWARSSLSALQSIASRPDVAHIYANPWVQLDTPEKDAAPTAPHPTAVEWNINKVGAPLVWAAGYTGQGAVVGGQDTGYDWDHPALLNQYRGWDGVAADHNYSWHDAIHENNPNTPAGNPCGFDSAVPCDDHGHGTHTMGTMVGDDGGLNQVGMAPEAQWVGCRNMEQGWGKPITYIECYQWFAAPTDLNNGNPRPDLAPHVINNSWGCPASEGCTDPQVMLLVVENVRAAGILTVHSAGNSGPTCGSVRDPAAIYDASFTVGNTTSADTIASNSSRGPVTVDGSNRPKPDISAPGSSIRSSYPGGSYTYMSGTSMAGPHVAGLAALLISAQPTLSGQVNQLEALIQQTALPLTTTESCGGVPGTQIPNNTFGWGRIDAWNAFQHLPHGFDISMTTYPTQVQPGENITYTIQLTHLHPLSITHNVILTDVLPLGSSLVNAAPAFTQQGDTLRWEVGDLAPQQNHSLAAQFVAQVVVLALPGAPGAIVNRYYGARSDQAPTFLGLPVPTLLGDYFYFWLIIRK
ncbi:MAG: S8 family serine peptidase [Anaerolineales bacterium]|nr:S8 family serine peptidase [Anaerolineales bacterium]